jgi:hypothetical protein
MDGFSAALAAVFLGRNDANTTVLYVTRLDKSVPSSSVGHTECARRRSLTQILGKPLVRPVRPEKV